MRFAKTSIIFMMMLVVVMVMTSCSSSSKVGELPVSPNLSVAELPTSFGNEDESGSSILATYDAVIDPVAKTFTVAPAERTADYHFPLTQNYPNVVQITDYGWTPSFWADIKLTHPFPGSGIDGFDPRVIAILPSNPGMSFHYPIFNCIGNNSVLMEPDGYTKLFDSIGGSIPGNTNPFKAYFKDQPYRVWSSTGVTSETQRWNLNLAGFGGSMQYKLVVDVSTNYPNSPQPVVDNSPEPVQIEAVIGDGLSPEGGEAPIEVTLLDWKGQAAIRPVAVESPELYNNTVNLVYSHPGPNPNEYIYEGTIYNDFLAPTGEYGLIVAAWDLSTGIYIYAEFAVFVSGVPYNPVDVTPPGLVFNYAKSVHVSNGYAYVAGTGGMHIIDIEPLESAYRMSFVETPGDSNRVYVSNSYAYVADGYYGLQIIDIEPPEASHIVKSVDTNDAQDVCVSNGYAYIIDWGGYLRIIDIDPLESAYIMKSVNTPDYLESVYVSNGYAYISAGWDGLQIIDIEPPESAYIVKSVNTTSIDVYVSSGYAYVATTDRLDIVDIDPPESAYVVSSVDTPGWSCGVHVLNGYAYVADHGSGLQIIDIEPPESAYILSSVDTPGSAYGVYVSNGYAYVADNNGGLRIIKLW